MPVIRADDLAFQHLRGRRTADPLRDLPPAGVSMRVVQPEPPPGRTPHRHPRDAELIYVVRGRGRIWEDGTSTPVGPGDTVLVRPGVAHMTLPDTDSPMTLICFFAVPDVAAATEELDQPSL